MPTSEPKEILDWAAGALGMYLDMRKSGFKNGTFLWSDQGPGSKIPFEPRLWLVVFGVLVTSNQPRIRLRGFHFAS